MTGARRGAHLDRWLVPVAIGGAVLALDQVTKSLIAERLGPGAADHRHGILEPALALHYVENTGAAFGAFDGRGALLAVLAVAVIVGIVVYYQRVVEPSRGLAVSLGLLLGGAIGNLVDRIRLGYVIDFVAVGVWPKFNVADSAITVGVLLLGWYVLVQPEAPRTAERRPEATGGTAPPNAEGETS